MLTFGSLCSVEYTVGLQQVVWWRGAGRRIFDDEAGRERGGKYRSVFKDADEVCAE